MTIYRRLEESMYSLLIKPTCSKVQTIKVCLGWENGASICSLEHFHSFVMAKRREICIEFWCEKWRIWLGIYLYIYIYKNININIYIWNLLYFFPLFFQLFLLFKLVVKVTMMLACPGNSPDKSCLWAYPSWWSPTLTLARLELWKLNWGPRWPLARAGASQ